MDTTLDNIADTRSRSESETPSFFRLALFGTGVVVLIFALVFIVAGLIFLGYGNAWTGFGEYISETGEFQRGKTLWD